MTSVCVKRYLGRRIGYRGPIPSLGLGGRTAFTGAALVAFGTWALSLLCAEAMRRRSYRGPAEILLRRLTYRKAA